MKNEQSQPEPVTGDEALDHYMERMIAVAKKVEQEAPDEFRQKVFDHIAPYIAVKYS